MIDVKLKKKLKFKASLINFIRSWRLLIFSFMAIYPSTYSVNQTIYRKSLIMIKLDFS